MVKVTHMADEQFRNMSYGLLRKLQIKQWVIDSKKRNLCSTRK